MGMKKLKYILAAIVILSIMLNPIVSLAEDDATDDINPMSSAKLVLDNQNRYEGMDRSYSEGYIPRVENGTAFIVVPITCSGQLKNNSITVSLNLGDTQSMPFVCKNYERTIYLQQSNVNDNTAVVEGYVASFALELKSDRYNGSYPVAASVSASDTSGQEVIQEFQLYVNITDGKNPDESETTEPVTEAPPSFQPKVLVQSYKFSKENVMAGEDVTVDITLINTSMEETVKNMTVSVKENGEFFSLANPSDTTFVENIPAGGTVVVSYSYNVNAMTPQGQYDFEVAMDYNDSKGGGYSGTGTVKLRVLQSVQVQFDELNISDTVQVADIVNAQVQAMNLGKSKVFNVRAVIEADGLIPDGTLFIGDMEAGQSATGSTEVSITGLSDSSSIYGDTKGTVTFYYEDGAGKEYNESREFTMRITSPFSESSKEEQDEPNQWWPIMAVLTGVILAFVICMVLRFRKHRRLVDEVV